MSFAQPPLFIYRLTPSYLGLLGRRQWAGVEEGTPPPLRTDFAAKYFFFSLFYSLAPARINGPFFSLSLFRSEYRVFKLRFSSPCVWAVSGRQPLCLRPVSLEYVCLFSLIMDPLEEEEAERLPRLSLGQFFGGWLRSCAAISRCLDELPPLLIFSSFYSTLSRSSSSPLRMIPI